MLRVKERKRRSVLQSARADGDGMRRSPGHLITRAGREEVMRKGGGEEVRSVRCMCDVCAAHGDRAAALGAAARRSGSCQGKRNLACHVSGLKKNFGWIDGRGRRRRTAESEKSIWKSDRKIGKSKPVESIFGDHRRKHVWMGAHKHLQRQHKSFWCIREKMG